MELPKTRYMDHASDYETAATRYFRQGYSCAQSVFTPFAAALGMSEETALRLSAGLGAGIGRMRGTCGTFCALTLIAGYCRGNLEGTPGGKERIYSYVRALAGQFKAEFGTLSCRELLHLGDSVQEGARPTVRTPEFYATRPCESCVRFCARLATRALEEHGISLATASGS